MQFIKFKKRRLIISSFIFFIFFIQKAAYTIPDYSIGKGRKYQIEYSVSFKNTSPHRSIFLEAWIPRIETVHPFQEVKFLGQNTPPEKIIKDKWGNNLQYYSTEINPHQIFFLNFKYDVTAYHILYDVSIESYKKFSKKNIPSEYLSPQPFIESDSPIIIKAGKEIIKNEERDLYKIWKIYDYIRTSFIFKEKLAQSALEAFNAKILQCCDASLLLVALCRGQNIPAKYIGGIYLYGDKETYKEAHAWANIFLDGFGWIPIDPTSGRRNDYYRFQAFAELDNCYIQMWNGFKEPFYFKIPNGFENYIKADFEIKVKRDKKKIPPVFYERKYFGKQSNFWYLDLNFSDASIKETTWDAYKYFINGQQLNSAGLTEEALFNFERAIQIDLRFIPAWYDYLLLCFKLNKLDTAMNPIAQFVYLFPSEPYYNYYAGLVLAYQGKYTQAQEFIEKSLNYGLISCWNFNSLGYIFLYTKQIQRAEACFNFALYLNNEFMPSWENLMYLFQTIQDWEKLRFYCLKALSIYPKNHKFLSELSYAYLQLEEIALAEENIKKAIRFSPDVGWYHIILGKIFCHREKYQSAYNEIRKGLELDKSLAQSDYVREILIEIGSCKNKI